MAKAKSRARPKSKTRLRSAEVKLEQARLKRAKQKYLLRLYITGTTPRSMAAVANTEEDLCGNLAAIA